MGWKEQDCEISPAIAVFADGSEMHLPSLLHGDAVAKHICVRPPAAEKRKGSKGPSKSSDFCVLSMEHDKFGTMKVTSKMDCHKQRFSCITSVSRKFVCQISSTCVPSLEVGHKVMREVANRLVKDKAIFEKADVYALRDVVAAEILGPDWAQRNKQAEDKEPGNETTEAMVEEPAKTSTKKQKSKAAKTDKPKVSAKDKDNKKRKTKDDDEDDDDDKSEAQKKDKSTEQVAVHTIKCKDKSKDAAKRKASGKATSHKKENDKGKDKHKDETGKGKRNNKSEGSKKTKADGKANKKGE